MSKTQVAGKSLGPFRRRCCGVFPGTERTQRDGSQIASQNFRALQDGIEAFRVPARTADSTATQGDRLGVDHHAPLEGRQVDLHAYPPLRVSAWSKYIS